MRYYIEEDTSTTPPTLVKVPIDGSFINYNTAPIGSIQQYSGTSLPQGWLWCNGAAYSRQYFPFLFKVIGTTYGTGDGSTTFNVPTIPDLATGIKYIIKAYSTADAKDLGIDTADPQDLPEVPGRWGDIEDYSQILDSFTDQDEWVAPATGLLEVHMNPPTGAVADTRYRIAISDITHGNALGSIWASATIVSATPDAPILGGSTNIIQKGHKYKIYKNFASGDTDIRSVFTPYITDSTVPVDDPGEVYSTTETRVGTWIDGKPIYRKVIVLTSTTPEVAMNRTIFRYDSVLTGVDKVINVIGIYSYHRTDINITQTMSWNSKVLGVDGTVSPLAGDVLVNNIVNLYTSFRTSSHPVDSCTIQASIEYTKV